jgi:hypothetical protein
MDYKKIKEFNIKKQLALLSCDTFRITLTPRLPDLKPKNYGNSLNLSQREEKGIAEKLWTCVELVEQVKDLTMENMKGYEIYVTPISSTHHYYLLDDMTPASLTSFKAAGYQPALVQESSVKKGSWNYQSVLIIAKGDHPNEQAIANSHFIDLNRRYGDSNIVAVVHPFRLAGFANKKPGRDDYLTKMIEMSGAFCSKTQAELASLRENYITKPGNACKPSSTAIKIVEISGVPDSVALETFGRQWKIEEKKVNEKGWALDLSKIDWQVCRNMHSLGFSANQIASAMIAASPNVSGRHADTHRYVTETVQRSSISKVSCLSDARAAAVSRF